MGRITDEIFKGLPAVHADFFDVVYHDTPGSSKRYNRTVSFSADQDMADALQNLAGDTRLPFAGNRSVLMRHLAAAGVESLKEFLSPEMQTTWSRIQNQQRRITNDTYARLIDSNLESDMANLTFLSSAKEWRAVVEHLERVRQELGGLDRVWRAYAARGWAGAMRGLKVQWANEMQFDAPEQWRKVRESLEWFDTAGGY